MVLWHLLLYQPSFLCFSALSTHCCRQQSQGLLPPGTAYDLFRGTAASQRDEVEAYPSSLAAKVTFGAKTHPEVAIFSPDGTMLVSGSSDGFIEVGVVVLCCCLGHGLMLGCSGVSMPRSLLCTPGAAALWRLILQV
jgi:hypothetical protein